MTTTSPDQTPREIDEAELTRMEEEKQEKEDKRDAAALNGNKYRELSAQIAKLDADIARYRATRPIVT